MINDPISGGDLINLYRDVPNSGPSPLEGAYLSATPLPFKTGTATIVNIAMNAACVEDSGGLRTAATCAIDVELSYCTNGSIFCGVNDKTYRSGVFSASGKGPAAYTINGGIGSFNDASGTIDATFDDTTFGYNNVKINMCFVFSEAGDAIKCINDSDGSRNPKMVYRLSGDNSIRHYPNLRVASSWDSDFFLTSNLVDCTDMTIDEEMDMYPSELTDGSALKCLDGTDKSTNNSQGYYRFTKGVLRNYVSPTIAQSWDPFYDSSPKDVDCTGLPFGPDMAPKPPVNDGDTIKCQDNTDGSSLPNKVYYFIGDEIRHYPTPDIAFSWNHEWNAGVDIDCTRLTIGPDMTLKPDGVVEGVAVKCSDNSDLTGNPNKVYRFTGAELRHYPDTTIAESWDPEWGPTYKFIDCDRIPIGEDTPLLQAA